MCIRFFATVAAALLLPACSIHPLPEDVTGVNTYHIVRQIRCETRAAAIDIIVRELRREAEAGDDAMAQRILGKYDADPEWISNFSPDLFVGPDYARYRDLYKVITTAAVAYNFDLTMSETNNLGTSVNLLGPWSPKFTAALGGDANRSRSNQRTFTVTDTFGELLKINTLVRGVRYCDKHLVEANFIYPVAGRIGVDEMVLTFFNLSLFGALEAQQAKPGAGGPPAMADKLTFTTTIDGSVNPAKVVFNPVGSGLQVADASLSGTLTRMDTHVVTVGLALDSKVSASLNSLRGYLFSRQRGFGVAVADSGTTASRSVRNAQIFNTLTADVGNSSAKELAVTMVDQQKSREFQLVRSR
ncbi:hypothetical protein QA645_40840 [Bradyrhizobium sp. CIAT3101]|uniref:hypothetical protein n=1 Tax=Bradyrhizobium sp. CIAT3101 TaxID=439387 RepID=UPI0024B0DFFF|nr:hypothetical protein [Bradyrhizobium sp. CIAT3101]WFU80701.1 hypothetical protein QA645_40840 [Bradyrhizobium sp. CIAT3101]